LNPREFVVSIPVMRSPSVRVCIDSHNQACYLSGVLEQNEESRSGPTHDPFTIQQFARVEQARSLFQNYLPQGFVGLAQ